MKKFVTYLLLTLLCLTLLLPLTAGAAEVRVWDEGWILSNSERAELEAQAERLSEKYSCGFYIATVYDYRPYGGAPFDAACAYYKERDLGTGAGKDGILLLLSMRDRDYALVGYGLGETALSDGAIDYIEEGFLPKFRNDRWEDGFRAYLDRAAESVSAAQKGAPMRRKLFGSLFSGFKGLLITLAMVVVLPCAAAAAVCLSWRGQMKSVRKGVEARTYMVAGSLDLRIREDTFTHATQVRRRIDRDRGSGGGGGGSVHHSGGGFSGSSGKF